MTKGKGCIDKTEPCSKYQGNQETCKNFVGNSKKCWNQTGSTADSFCVDRKCSDAENTIISDDICKQFLDGCVTNGKGCIE